VTGALGVAADEPRGDTEPFGLFWPGKRDALCAATAAPCGRLVPVPGEGIDEATTGHLFVEGDNLEALKLLHETHAGRIKLIYIDPPYNTGNGFVYDDDFSESLEAYARRTGPAADRDAGPSANSRGEGRQHAKWLTMMVPRLVAARPLLAENGVIFVSIDDTEVHHLRAIMNEIFGEEQFIAQICHKARASVSNDKIISSSHNHILLYARDFAGVFAERRDFGLAPDLEGFDLEDEHGAYKLVPVDGPGGARKANPFYEFLGVRGYFRFSRETMQRLYDEGLVVKRGNSLQQKYYKSKAAQSRRTDTTWWDDGYLTSTATARLAKLIGDGVFENPKPVELIDRMLELWARDGDIVLDFFAGSGTTGAAVLERNHRERIRCTHILVQSPEPTRDPSPARTAGFERVSDIAKERLRRVAARLRAQTPSGDEDVGFRVLRHHSTDSTSTRA
jgi:adenine-specific DNA-methyltransferase